MCRKKQSYMWQEKGRGLGLRGLKDFNSTLLAKWIWRLGLEGKEL